MATVDFPTWVLHVFLNVLLTHNVMAVHLHIPIGIHLCERICLKTIGCSSYIYMTPDLLCHVTGDETFKIGQTNYVFNVTAQISTFDRNCSVGFQVIKTRSGNYKCIDSIPNSGRQTNETERDRIIFLPYKKPTQVLHIYYPASHSHKTVKLGATRRISTIVDFSTTKIVLYTALRQIILFNIQSGKSTMIFRPSQLWIVDWCQGPTRLYVLTGTIKGRRLGVLREDKETWKYEELTVPSKFALCTRVACDKKTNTLYALCKDRIQVFGNHSFYIYISYRTRSPNIASVSPDVIYITDLQIVRSLNLYNGSSSEVVILPSGVFMLTFCHGSLFMSKRMNDGAVWEYKGTLKRLITIESSSRVLIA